MGAAAEAARGIAARAGELATLEVRTKNASDFVSDVDVETETLIRARLSSAFPAAHIMGEELSPGAAPSAGLVFAVDPLDGTTNFLHGYPEYAVSICAAVNGELAAAVVHNAAIGEVFTARRGAGAFRDGKRISVSNTTDPTRALIGTGFPFRAVAVLNEYLQRVPRGSARDRRHSPRRRRLARSVRCGLRTLRRLLGAPALPLGFRGGRAARARSRRHCFRCRGRRDLAAQIIRARRQSGHAPLARRHGRRRPRGTSLQTGNARLMKLVECVPNFSEGRRPDVVQAIVDAMKAVDGVVMLDVSSDASHNRTVVTLVVPAERAVDAAFAGMKEAARAHRSHQTPGRAPAHGRDRRRALHPARRRHDGRLRGPRAHARRTRWARARDSHFPL